MEAPTTSGCRRVATASCAGVVRPVQNSSTNASVVQPTAAGTVVTLMTDDQVRDVRDLTLESLRANIGVIFQDFVRYHLPVRENIGFGQIDALDDFERIAAAARKSGAHAVVEELPDGYETMLGRWFHDGHELSLGQWQKIALARAFLRDAQIVILDEPTSALDARAEAELFERFLALFHDRTAILVSHRLSTVKMVDRIYFMENGRIVESGSHDDLIDRGGGYAEMFEIQARRYR